MARPTKTGSLRNARVSIVMTAATYDGVAALAAIRGCSLNDLINEIIEGVVKKNSTAITNYQKTIGNLKGEISLFDEDVV